MTLSNKEAPSTTSHRSLPHTVCCEPDLSTTTVADPSFPPTLPPTDHQGIRAGACLEELCTCADLPVLVSSQRVTVPLVDGRVWGKRLLNRGAPFGCSTHPWQVATLRRLPQEAGGGAAEVGEASAIGVSLTYLASDETPPPFSPHTVAHVSVLIRTASGATLAHRTLLNHFSPASPTWGMRSLIPTERIIALAGTDATVDLTIQVGVRPLEAQAGWIDVGIAEACPGVEDVILHTHAGQECLSAARVALAARSRYFKDLFLADFPYPPPDDYPVDEEPDILRHLIHFSYHGSLPPALSPSRLRALYAAATRLRFPDLRAILSAHLTAHLDLPAALALVPLAWEYGDAPMKSALLRLLHRERRGLPGREDFVRLVRTGAYPDLVAALVDSPPIPAPSPSS